LAQLNNYEKYFAYKRNCRFAYDKYGVSVFEPRLILVVGSQDTFDEDEVREALEVFGDKRFTIMDYDTLALTAAAGA
jgi:hypothetical protein